MTLPGLTDSHCHLDFEELSADLPGVLARAEAAGVTRIVTISTLVRKEPVYRALAEAHPNVWFTVGTHPNSAWDEPDAALSDLKRLSAHPRCVAIGEAGLDFHYDKSPRDVQERVFRTHIAAARETGLPLVIHARDADDEMIRILGEEHGRGRFGAVLHCFSSTPRLAAFGVSLGFYVSFSGILTFRNSTELRRVAAEIVPRDRLLVETDAPFLAPVPLRGRTNEPSYTVETAKILADTIGVPFDEVVRLTSANVERLFPKIVGRPARSEAA